jgi:hypothetical protein
MQFLIAVALVLAVGVGLWSLWDRFRPDDLPERLLKIPGLESICQEYLETIKQMKSGRFSTEEIHTLDSERQWLHNEILRQLELSRDDDLDVERFARRYLGW